jgi:hypothetical protein
MKDRRFFRQVFVRSIAKNGTAYRSADDVEKVKIEPSGEGADKFGLYRIGLWSRRSIHRERHPGSIDVTTAAGGIHLVLTPICNWRAG